MEANANNAQEDTGVSEGQTDLKYSRFCVHDWVVDPKVGHISLTGETIRLEPKVMDVLVYLAERPGEAVTRAELEETVWADVVVSYETLTSTIQKLRKAFNDDAHAPRFIETLPKRGYRLVAPVRPLNGTDTDNPSVTTPLPESLPRRRRRLIFLGVLVLAIASIAAGLLWPDSRPASIDRGARMENAASVLPDKPSIAVLPFKNMSDDKAQEYFSDGLTEDLITDLSKVSGLFVISRNSTSYYKGQSSDVRDVGKKLGASHVIEGSVRKAGGTVRITVQLVDAANGRQLWAERYDRNLKDVFAIQDEVTGKIISMLSVKLTLEEKARVADKGTENLEAYDLFMRGREQESFFTKDSFVEAENYYSRAIALDPDYANAYARMTMVLGLGASLGWAENREQAYEKSLQMAKRAVALAPSLPFAHFALGYILSRPGFADHDIAKKELETSVKLDPSFADGFAFLALEYNYTGDAPRALEIMEKAMKLNPIFPFWYYHNRGMSKYLMGNYAGAVEDVNKAAERNPTVFFVRFLLAAALAQVGRIEDAQWQADELAGMGFDPTLDNVLAQQSFQHPPYLEKYTEGLRKAGFK